MKVKKRNIKKYKNWTIGLLVILFIIAICLILRVKQHSQLISTQVITGSPSPTSQYTMFNGKLDTTTGTLFSLLDKSYSFFYPKGWQIIKPYPNVIISNMATVVKDEFKEGEIRLYEDAYPEDDQDYSILYSFLKKPPGYTQGISDGFGGTIVADIQVNGVSGVKWTGINQLQLGYPKFYSTNYSFNSSGKVYSFEFNVMDQKLLQENSNLFDSVVNTLIIYQ